MRCFPLFCLAAAAFFPLIAPAADVTGKVQIPDAPAWSRNAVFYQIYPQSYYDSNGDGIGDLNGIIQKLDYIKSLGVDAIWINPFFDSPFLDAGYDIRNYYKVAPRYGTNEDAKRLFAEAHKRGIKVLFDYVISYTSIENPWFKASCQQSPNRYSNWYIWTDNMWAPPPGEFSDKFVQGYGQRNGMFMRNFFWSEPALNFGFGKPDPAQKWQLSPTDPAVKALREELKNVFTFWMDMGADGIRADMAGSLVKGEDPGQNTKKFWQEIRQLVKAKYPDAFMVSEWSYPKDALDGAFHADFFHWVDGYNDLTQKESWRILNGMSDGHSFFDSAGLGDISRFLKQYLEHYEATRGKGYINLPIGNHDIARLNTKRTPAELEMIIAFGLTMPGTPFLYYGNEIGMRQLSNDTPQIEGAYQPRAGARTPMQWTSGRNLGFSTAEPAKLYLPVDSAADAPNVEAQERDPNSLLNRVKKLIQLKHAEPALAAYAEFVPLFAEKNAYPFVFARANGSDVVLVIFNPAARTATAKFQLNVSTDHLQLLAGDPIPVSRENGQVVVQAGPVSYAVYKLK